MAKPPVLGNDPFQRGAAPRPPPEPSQPAASERPEEEGSPAPAKDSKGAAGAGSGGGPPEGPQGPAAPQRPSAPPRPRRPRRRPAESPAAGRAPQAEAQAPGRRPPKRRAKAPARAPAEAPKPSDEGAGHVFEGELILEGADRDRRLAVAPVSEALFGGPPPTPGDRSPSGLLRRALGTASAFAQTALVRASDSEMAKRAARALQDSTLAQRMALAAASAAQAARPAFALAERLLPPARTALAAVMTGEAARELAAVAAAAGEAARKAATRVEPGVLELDPFGEDPALLSRVEPLLDFLHEHYFRVQTFGADRVEPGACILVANHAGALPLDGLVLRTALRRECGRPDARWLVEDALFHAPFVGTWLTRLGAIRACPENAERLLAQGVALAVFPEGLLGISKPLARRYQLQRFGRGGFVKLALRTGAPIIPVAVVGAEEATPLLAKIPLSTLGLPYLPLTSLPLPVQWKISFLEPVRLRRGPDAEQPELIAQHTAEIRQAIQHEVNRLRSLSSR